MMGSRCIFCNIASGEAPAQFVHQDEKIVVFKDIHPHAPVHLLIVPRKHIRSVNELTGQDKEVVAQMVLLGRDLAEKEGIHKTGYKLLFNVERGGGQVIFHLHLHLMGGW